VSGYLTPAEADLFWAQPTADQRHAHDCGKFVAAKSAEDCVVNAALLHDIGKRHSGLGLFGRSYATIAGLLTINGTSDMQAYNQHGPVGADELVAVGASKLAVDFARHHQSGVNNEPAEKTNWDLLLQADLNA
jgi:hypothetical protein